MKQNKIPRNEYIKKPVGKTDPYADDVFYTNLGQWKYPGQVTRIPSNDITMQGVPYPVYGEDDLGYGQMMYPGMDYTFPGQYVTEIPMAQKGEQVENRTLWGVGSQFIPVYETYLDWKNIASGIKTGNKSDKYAGIIGLAQPFSGKALSNTLDYATEKTLGKKTADYNQKKREDIVNMSQHDREKLFLKYGHGGYDAWAKDGFPELAYGGDPSLPNIEGHYKTGGWLDEIEDEFRRGGGYATPPKLRRKAKKYGTSKNIQSSINKIFTKNKLFTRNYDVFGPSGKNIYNPNSKYEEGGVWLEEYQAGGSIVDYLSKKGIDSSKENRKKLAQQYGVKDYNFTAEKNIELLNKLVAGKPVAQKTVAPKPIPSYLQPIKPIEKPNAKSDRTGQKKNVKIASDADLYSEDAKWYNSLPKEEKEFIKRSTAAQYKEPDELKQYVPQGKISKAWDVITNPISALEEYHKHGRIPDNLSESPDRNAIDMAVDVINPAFYINAAGRTAKNLTSADTYSDIAKGLGAAAIGLTGEEAPDEWVEGGLNTLDRALDAVTAAQGLKLVKTIPRGYRDMKYNNQITVGKGADKKTFKNSADFLEAHKAKMKAAGKDIPLKKKEIAFLNKEIKQRGVLEASRRHPLDPRSAMAKAMVIPEDYNWKTVLNPKNIARNLYKTATEGSPESLYQMGHGRVAGWNTYLGIPTKNNPYRIHPESFKQGEDLLYTLPEKQIEKVQRMNVKSGSPFASDQMSPKKGIKELEFFKNIPAKKTKAFNEKAYDKVASDMRKVLDDQGNRYYTNAEIKETLGPKSKFKYTLKKHKKLAGDNIPDFMTREGNMYRTGDWDRYIGSHGGVGWKVVPDEATGKQRWIMEDVWDIQPLSRIQSKAVPQFVKDLDFGKVLGGKNYKVRLDYLKNLNSNRITPLVPKKMGGWLDNMD